MHKKVVYDTKQPYTKEDPWAKDINVWKVSSKPNSKTDLFTSRLLGLSIPAKTAYLRLMPNIFKKSGLKNKKYSNLPE